MVARKPVVDGKMQCNRCREWKLIGDDGEFSRDNRRASGHQSRCRSCDSLASRESREKHYRGTMIRSARRRAQEQGVPFDLTTYDIIVPESCPILGIPLFMGDLKNRDNSPSLDKIDPDMGYVPGNVQVISDLANRMKTNASPEQLLAFADWALKTYGGG